MPICLSHSHCGVVATVVLLPQPSPSSTKVIPPKPQTSPRNSHNSHRAVATTVTFIHNNHPRQCHNSHHATLPQLSPCCCQYHYRYTIAVHRLPCWCHHPHHTADTTTLTMPLPQLSRLCCHIVITLLLPCCNNRSFRSIFQILSVLFPHRSVATHHTILLPHFSHFSCHSASSVVAV
jgi:hypothetical protein